MAVKQLRLARVLALQALYQLDCGRGEDEISCFFAQGKADQGVVALASELARGAWAERHRLDEALATHLEDWSVPRLGVVERAVLRLALYELLYRSEVPVAVVIDEAVGLAKRFASERSGALVNAVLDKAKVLRDESSRAR